MEELQTFLDRKNLYQYLGVTDPSVLPINIKNNIESENLNLKNYIKPIVYNFETNKFFIEEGKITIQDITINSRVLSKIGRDAFSVFIFILTIGDEIENLSSQLYSSNQLFMSQLVDAWGSVFVEAAADCFMHNIEASLTEGFILSARYSSGYCDIDVREQEKIFKLIGEENRLVRLNESFQMIPQKSISGIFFKVDSKRGTKYKKYFIFCKDCSNRLCKYFK